MASAAEPPNYKRSSLSGAFEKSEPHVPMISLQFGYAGINSQYYFEISDLSTDTKLLRLALLRRLQFVEMYNCLHIIAPHSM